MVERQLASAIVEVEGPNSRSLCFMNRSGSIIERSNFVLGRDITHPHRTDGTEDQLQTKLTENSQTNLCKLQHHFRLIFRMSPT